MQTQVITYSTPAGAKLVLTTQQVELLQKAGSWPRAQNGSEFCNVSFGEHFGAPDYTDAEIEMIVEDGGSIGRAHGAMIERLYPQSSAVNGS